MFPVASGISMTRLPLIYAWLQHQISIFDFKYDAVLPAGLAGAAETENGHQREGFRGLVLDRRLLGRFRQGKQLGQVQLAVRIEQHLGVGPRQAHQGQMRGEPPQAAPLQVRMQLLEGQLGRCGLTDAQTMQVEPERERIELQPLQLGGHGGVLRQLLIGDAQRHPGRRLLGSHL